MEPTALQQRVRTVDRLHPADPISNMGHRYRMPTAIDPDRFVAAIARVVERCDVLRMVVDPSDDAWWVRAQPPAPTRVVDVPADRAEQWARDRISTPVDPTRSTYDSVLLRHGDDDWSWWMCIHHMATDAASAGLVASAVFVVYDDESVDLDELIDGEFFASDLIADARLRHGERDAGGHAPLAWYGAAGERTSTILRHDVDPDDRVRSALLELLDGDLRSLSRDLSTLALAASAIGVLEWRFRARSTLDLGVPLHQRGTRRARHLVGPLMEIHPLRVTVERDDTFRRLHQRTLRSIMDLLRSAELGTAPDRAGDIVLNVIRRPEMSVAGVDVVDEWVRPERVEPSVMLQLLLVDVPDGEGGRRLDIELEENAAFRPDGLGVGPAVHLAKVFEAVVADPDVSVDAIAIVGDDEVEAHRAFVPEPHPRPVTETVPLTVARRLAESPDRVVAESDGVALTAAEFDARVDAMARRLDGEGVGPGDRVGLRTERSIGVLVAITAIHRLGASFVMLSPTDPPARIDAIRADAGLVAVLGSADLDVSTGGDGSFSAASPESWHSRVSPSGEAYVLYTSGSTGKPKGVPISHHGLADYLAFAVDEYATDATGSAPVVALHSELMFDLTVTSLFLGLVTGGLTVVVGGSAIDALAAVAGDDRITFLKATPSQLELYLALVGPEARPLTCIVVGGEAFRRPLAERLALACEPGVVIVNEYGPTEAVVGCMVHRWDPTLDVDVDVPVGVASAGSQLLVLDHVGQLAAIGTWGELWVRRPGMAQGYLGLDEVSARRFVDLADDLVEQVIPSGANHDGLWYRTGDRVRMQRPGVLVYGGRDDDQLKVRGIRLEPGEVESALVAHPSIEQAHVRLWNPADHGSSGVEILTAWYRSGDGQEVADSELRDHLRSRVPDHAVPSAYVRIDDIALANGTKIDLSALPAPSLDRDATVDRVEPVTSLERRLCEIWSDHLGVERVGTTDDFFDLGGASLAALAVVAAVDEEFGTDLPDAALFDARTVRQLAALVENDAHAGDVHPVPRLAPGEPPPWSEPEEAMLFAYRSDPADPRYNTARLYTLRPTSQAPIDRDRLVESIRDVVMRHEPLHVTHGPRRRRLEREDCLSVRDLGEIGAEEMSSVADRATRLPFDLDSGPIVRIHHAMSPDGAVFVLVGIHHIAVDAVTFDAFWSQVARRHTGADLGLPTITYAEHMAWQRDRLDDVFADDEEFWLDQGTRRPDDPGLPFVRPTPAEADGYVRRDVDIDPAVFARDGATGFSRSMAAVAMTLSSVRGSDRVEFGVTTSTNDRADTADLVGYYLNTLPVVVDAGHRRPVADVVASTTALVPDLVAHRRRPLARIVREARAAGLPEPSIDVALAFQQLATPTFPGAEVEQRVLWSGASVFDCTFFVQQRVDRIEIGMEHRGSVIGASDALRLLDTFEEALRATVELPDRSVGAAVTRTTEADLVGAATHATATRPVPADILDSLRSRTDEVAVVDAVGEVSAGALIVAVDELVETMVDAAGADVAGSRVAVTVERSAAVVVAMLATWFAGATYVPIDPTVPRRRRERVLDVARPALRLVDSDRAGREAATPADIGVGRPSAVVDEVRLRDAIERLARRAEALSADDAAYVIFTSGSTGAPKGVEVTHANLAASTVARSGVYPHAPSRFLVTSSIGFDSSLVGLVWPLTAGGAVVIPADDVTRDVDRLGDVIADASVSHVLMVPSAYRSLLERRADRLVALDTAIVAGEATDSALVELHHEVLPGVALVDEYGPTEATIWAASGEHRPGRAPTIGGPIPGVRLRLVGGDDRPVALGAAGELLISGPTVTDGYVGDDTATARRFVDLDGARWYRTGDRVRVVGSGEERELAFVGRVDDQLNVGGNRLEPAEVERALTSVAGVHEAAVVAGGDPVRVVAHVVATDFDETSVREALAEELPTRSMPTRFVVHVDLPRTVHGKIDRRSLEDLPVASAPTPTAPSSAIVGADDEPADGSLATVVDVWRDALGRDDIGPDSDFFAVGGDSLTAVVIVTDLGDRLGREVAIADLIVGLTPRGLSERIGLDAGIVPDTGTGDGATVGVRIFTLRTAPAGSPAIVLTSGWDDVFAYQALAEAMPDGIAVVALGIDPTVDEPDARTVEGFAHRAEQLVGPILAEHDRIAIAGWSIGGLGAVELAKRLGAAGREGSPEVRLVLIDTIFPGENERIWANRWSKYRSLVRPGGAAAILGEMRATLRRRFGGPIRRLGLRLVRLGGAEAEIAAADTARRSVGVPDGLISNYRVEPISVPVLLISASTTNPKRTVRRWRHCAAASFEEVVVEGRHRGFDSIMQAGRVEAVAQAIADSVVASG